MPNHHQRSAVPAGVPATVTVGPVTHGPLGFESLAIHAGQEPDPTTGSVNVPIHASTTFAQDGVGGTRNGYEYGRTGNPTRTALEECLAALEGGRRAFAFASGMAAEATLLHGLLAPGQHVLIPDDAYGGTFRLFDASFAKWDLSYTPVALTDLDAVRAAIRPGETTMLWVETPTNPLLTVADIGALAEIAHAADIHLVVDNTFATPYLQQPLPLGADVVVHSTTKYANGHSDSVGGALVVNDPVLADLIAFHSNALGAVPGPFDSYLVLRGLKTLAVRMDRHSDNAEAIVAHLTGHPKVAQVYYPGLSDHPGHDVAQRQMRRFGGMVSFRHADGAGAAVAACGRARLFTLAESLGGVESLIEHPASMTHASVTGSPLAVPDDLIRLSVGLESVDDLIADLDQLLVGSTVSDLDSVYVDRGRR